MAHSIEVELKIDGESEFFEFIPVADKNGNYTSLGEQVNLLIQIKQKEWK